MTIERIEAFKTLDVNGEIVIYETYQEAQRVENYSEFADLINDTNGIDIYFDDLEGFEEIYQPLKEFFKERD